MQAIKKQEDPEDKKGIVGVFCRTYTIQEAIETFLSHVYTPAEEGYGEIRVNGTIKPIEVISNRPLTPTITYPPQGAIDLPDGFEITTSAFVSADPNMTHYATHWQIATDPDFVEVVFDEVSTTDLVDMATFGLDEGIAYYIRAMYIGEIA